MNNIPNTQYANIISAYRAVNSINKKFHKTVKNVINPQIIAHFASIVTIISIYFSFNNWTFYPQKISTWIVIIVCLVLLGFGVYSINNNLNKQEEMVVTFSELQNLLTVSRYEAKNSIINLGGDISWLENDIESIRNIKSEHKDVNIKIYYDRNKLSQGTKNLIRKIRKENIIEFIPYPKGITPPNIRCMITDYKFRENSNCKIFTYAKEPNSINNNDRINNKFIWKSTNIQNNQELYEIVSSLIESLERIEHKRIIVGISGVNNTGKTSLINECKNILSENFKVKIIPDTFYLYPTDRDFFSVNKKIIFHQSNELNKYNNYDIVIFDRTPFDNLMYMMMREYHNDIIGKRKINSILNDYSDYIKNLMYKFDLVYRLDRNENISNIRTTHISIANRKVLLSLYNKYYIKFIPHYNDANIFTIRDGENFAKDIKNTAKTISNQISDYYYFS